MSPDYITEVEEYITEMYARKGDMFAEAQGQWLDSCLECPEQYNDYLLDNVHWHTICWLEGHMSNYSPNELSPGGVYHWMVLATEQANGWER